MTDKIKGVSNPLTIIAIFAALAEVLGTVSLGLIDVSLQPIFIWFIILFPTLLIILFFLTLNFNTKSIYAPGDFKNEDIFKSLFMNEISEPDQRINTDREYKSKTLKELGIKESKDFEFEIPEVVDSLFSVRFNIEKELVRLSQQYLDLDRRKPIIFSIKRLMEEGILTDSQASTIRNIYSIASKAIHSEEDQVTVYEMDFVRSIAPGLINELRKKK